MQSKRASVRVWSNFSIGSKKTSEGNRGLIDNIKDNLQHIRTIAPIKKRKRNPFHQKLIIST
jgi:hypothetical protein